MPELVSWLLDNPVRWVIPAILLVSVAGIPAALWWEKRHPSVPAAVAVHAAAMRGWHRLSKEEQADADARAISAASGRDLEAAELREREATEARERVARLGVERAAQINAQFRP